MEYILKEWYGYEKGASELPQYLPKEEKIQDVVDKIINKNMGPKEKKFMELKKEWGKLMGTQIERISSPVSLKNNILTIEVENSAWLMELKNFHGRLIEKKIKNFSGKNFCYKIIYVLKGYKK